MTTWYRTSEGERVVHERYRALLEEWPRPNEQLSVSTREGETFVVRSGPASAPPVLLLHGAMATSATWIGDAADWSRHFRVHAVDVIGEAGFSAPSRPPYDSDRYALWLDDVMDGLGLERAALIGISLGGWLATDYAARRSERVAGAILLCPGGIGRTRMSTFRALVTIAPLLLLGDWGRRRAFRKVLGRIDPPPREAAAAAAALEAFLMLIAKHFRPRTTPLAQFGDATLQRLTMPVLAILGGRDALLDSEDTRRRLDANVPHAEVLYLPDAGHAVIGHAKTIREFMLGSLIDEQRAWASRSGSEG